VKGAGKAFFWKQWGGPVHDSGGDLLDGQQWQEFPTTWDREAA
jgi:protein gp37